MLGIKKLCWQVVAPSAVLIGGFLVAISLRDSEEPVEVVKTSKSVRSVGVIAPLRYHGPVLLNAHGVAVPHREVVLTSQVGGSVLSVADSLQSGRFVKAGECLVHIDDRQLRIEVKLLEAKLASVRIDQAEAEKQLDLLKLKIDYAIDQSDLMHRDYQRVKNTARSFAASASQVDVAKEKWLQAKQAALDLQSEANTQLAQIRRANVQRACNRLELEKLNLEIERTKVCAPIDGLVVRAHVEKGTTLSSGDRLVTIQDTNAIEVSCSLVPEQLSRVSGGLLGDLEHGLHQSTASDHALPNLAAVVSHRHGDQTHRWNATLSRCDGTGFDEKTRTLPCRLIIRQPKSDTGALLRRGMFVNVAMQLPDKKPMIAIPSKALRAGDQVWLLSGGQLQSHKVRVAAQLEELTVLYGDPVYLSEASRVVVTDLNDANSGKPIDQVELVAWNPHLPSRQKCNADPNNAAPRPLRQKSAATLAATHSRPTTTAWTRGEVSKGGQP